MDNGQSRTDSLELLCADPGLPRQVPTQSYWMKRPSHLAKHQSQILPSHSDVVIVGSGITAAIVAKTVLQRHPTYVVTILEARDICSGATGRNGGHLIAYGGTVYKGLKEAYGREVASQVIGFTFENIEKTVRLIREHSSDEEFRQTIRYRAYGDEQSFREVQESVAEFEADNPQWAGMYKFIGREVAEKEHSIHGVCGVCIFAAGALSPYRLVSAIYQHLLNTYSRSRFSLEANTPVTKVTYHQEDNTMRHYVVSTPRGELRASHVVYCTNGHTGHLLPSLRGRLYPFRGSMTVQDLGGIVPNLGASTTWSVYHQPRRDSDNGLVAVGTLYLQQNPSSGYFYFGGNKGTLAEMVTGDDSITLAENTRYLVKYLRSFMGVRNETPTRLVSEWTGIMGFTADGMPLVGRLPQQITGRPGQGEWIAAGFNGMGMSICVSSGEAIGRMLAGEDAHDSLPLPFKVTLARLEKTLTVARSEEKLGEIFSAETDRIKTRL